MRIRLLTGLLAGLFSVSALAGGSATMRSADGEVRIEYDGDRMRMDTGDDAYMVVRDGRMYMITGGMVLDASSMMAQTGAVAPASDVASLHGIKATGRSETVAGIDGEVHIIDFTDDRGQRQQVEAVLSDDPRARDLQRAWEAMLAAVGGDQANADLAEMRAALGGRGILRYGDEMAVARISGETPPAARFALPAKPMSLDGMGVGDLFGR